MAGLPYPGPEKVAMKWKCDCTPPKKGDQGWLVLVFFLILIVIASRSQM